MVANIHQQTALTAMSDAVDTLASQYRRNRGVNIRRDHLKTLVSKVLRAVQDLIVEEGALCDPQYIKVDDLVEAIDVCFQDEINADDELEARAHPAFSQRSHGTWNRQQQGIR